MGHRITQAAAHLSVDEVKARMNTDGRAFVRRHWWIIYNALERVRRRLERKGPSPSSCPDFANRPVGIFLARKYDVP